MPMFICDRCSTIENTACGDHGANMLNRNKPKLCSACMKSVPPYRKGGEWHGRFERRVATPALREALAAGGHERFNEMPEGFAFADMPLWQAAA